MRSLVYSLPHNLSGGDGLAGMALGVVGTMEEQTANGGGESLAADAAGLIEIGCGEGLNTAQGVFDSLPEFAEQLGVGGVRGQLGFERGQLLGAELATFGIGEQTVEAAHDVAQVEGDGGDIRGTGVKGFGGQRGAPLFDVLAGELEGMDDGSQDRRDCGVGSAQPGFGAHLFHFHTKDGIGRGRGRRMKARCARD